MNMADRPDRTYASGHIYFLGVIFTNKGYRLQKAVSLKMCFLSKISISIFNCNYWLNSNINSYELHSIHPTGYNATTQQ